MLQPLVHLVVIPAEIWTLDSYIVRFLLHFDTTNLIPEQAPLHKLKSAAYWLKGTSTENWVRTGSPASRGTVVFHFRAACMADSAKP